MRLFFLFFFYLFSIIAFANDKGDSSNTDTYKRLYKLDLFRAFQGTMQLSHEGRIKKNWTYNIGAMGTYASTRGLAKPYLKAQNFNYTDVSDNQTYNLDNVELLGYGINIQLRKYLGKSASPLEGYYAAPELFFRQLNLRSSIDYKYNMSPTGQVYKVNQTVKDVSKTLFLGYAGYAIGYQKIIRSVVCIDTYIGGGFFYSKYADANKPTRYRNNYQIDFTGIFFNGGVLIGITR